MILKNCNKCKCKISERLYEVNNWICNTCKNIPQEVKVKEVKVETSWDTYNWLPLYTASYLTHELKKNYNSIKNEKICIKYKDKYILHSDIIEQFKNGLDKAT